MMSWSKPSQDLGKSYLSGKKSKRKGPGGRNKVHQSHCLRRWQVAGGE